MALVKTIAEFSVKDAASKSITTIFRENEKARKSLKASEDQAKKTGKAIEDIKKSQAKAGAGGAAGKAGSSANALFSSAAGGNIVQGAAAQVPVVGEAIGAMLGAISGAAQDFTRGLGIVKERQLIESNFSAHFKKTTLANDKLITDTFYHIRDTKKALTALSDLGVKPETLAKTKDFLAEFAKAQGHTTQGEAVSALQAGAVKRNRGYDEQQIRQFQALSKVLQMGGPAAEAAMQQMARVHQISKGAKQAATDFENTAKAVKVVRDLEEFEKSAAIEDMGTIEDVRAARTVEKTGKAVRNTLSDILTGSEGVGDFLSGASTVRAIKKRFFSGGEKNPPGKAHGGPVAGGSPYLVGERGPELVVPRQAGNVIPANKTRDMLKGGGNKSVTVNVTNHFSVDGGNPRDIAKHIEQSIRTGMRMSLGLAPV